MDGVPDLAFLAFLAFLGGELVSVSGHVYDVAAGRVTTVPDARYPASATT